MEVYIKNFIIAVLIAISTFFGNSAIRSVRNEERISQWEQRMDRQEEKMDKILKLLLDKKED